MITKTKAVELIERAVAEKGADYVDPNSTYGRCTYANSRVKPTACGCIVGHALFYEGATVAQLHQLDKQPKSSILALLDWDQLDALPVEIDKDAARVFMAAQRVQDTGHTWGLALERAREAAA
ncbi:hypothetical protein [Amycolatopsis sp. NPDC003731]